MKSPFGQLKLWGVRKSCHFVYSTGIFLPICLIIIPKISSLIAAIGLHEAGLGTNLIFPSIPNLYGLILSYGVNIVLIIIFAYFWIMLIACKGFEFIGLGNPKKKLSVGILWGICLQFFLFLILILSTCLKIDAISFNNLAILNVLMGTIPGLNAGLTEEIVFRGVLFSSWQSRWNWWTSAVFTSSLFGLFHLCNSHYDFPISTALNISFLGLLFAWSKKITGSLWIPIGIHFMHDAAIQWFNLEASPLPHLVMTIINAPKWVVGNGGLSDWILAIVFAGSLWILYIRKKSETISTNRNLIH